MKLTAPGLLLLLVVLLLAGLEWRSRRAGNIPGQLYPAFCVTDSLISQQMLRSDGQGMNYMDSSYHWMDGSQRVNKQGFIAGFDYEQRVIDSLRGCGKKIVFLIGDSYVAGVTTTTFDKTFAQRLQHNKGNYVVFNFGVAGTDPLQYALVARRFINLHPDLLLVAFCGANDVMQYDHDPTPGIPLYYQTNAGWLSSVVPAADKAGKNLLFTTPEEAYRYYERTTTLYHAQSLPAQLCRHLSITTQLYFWFCPGLPEGNYKPGFDCGASYKYLHDIDMVCKANHVPFEIAVTPDPDKALLKNLKTRSDCVMHYQGIFKDLMPVTYFITGFDIKTDFKATDKRHFSDEGNCKFADFLNGVIVRGL